MDVLTDITVERLNHLTFSPSLVSHQLLVQIVSYWTQKKKKKESDKSVPDGNRNCIKIELRMCRPFT